MKRGAEFYGRSGDVKFHPTQLNLSAGAYTPCKVILRSGLRCQSPAGPTGFCPAHKRTIEAQAKERE